MVQLGGYGRRFQGTAGTQRRSPSTWALRRLKPVHVGALGQGGPRAQNGDSFGGWPTSCSGGAQLCGPASRRVCYYRLRPCRSRAWIARVHSGQLKNQIALASGINCTLVIETTTPRSEKDVRR